MTAPPANAPGPDSGVIMVQIPALAGTGKEGAHSSPAMRIFGVSWRLVVVPVPPSAVALHLPPFPGHEYDIRPPTYHSVQLQCGAAADYELWCVRVRLVMHSMRVGPHAQRVHKQVHHTFSSWGQPYVQLTQHVEWIGPNADAVSVGMWIEEGGARFGSRRQPPIDSLRAYRSDVVLVSNNGGNRFVANKQVLCNAALGFLHIFIQRGVEKLERENKEDKEGKEKKKEEKALEEVEIDLAGKDPQDFQHVLRMIYGMPTPLTESNVGRLLSITDMFDVKFVRDRLENFLLSSKDVTLYTKQTLARVYDLQMLKEELLSSGDLAQNPGQGK